MKRTYHYISRRLGPIALILGASSSLVLAEPVVDVTAAAGPGVPAAARTEEISTVKTTGYADGSIAQSSKLELRSIPPTRLQNHVVVDSSGSTVATVDRVIEAPSGKGIRYLVLSDQERKYIVPASAFSLGERDGELALQLIAEPARLANAPIFVESRVTEYSNREIAQPILSYWGAEWEE